MRFGRENRDDSYRNTDLLKAIFCAFFDATVGVAHSETVDIDGGAAAMERASAARARERLRRAFAAMRLEAVENEDGYAVYLADHGLDALARVGTAVIATSAAVPACAAFLGDLELLRLALELGYEWNWETCASAAMSGQLECLKYARERGCDWSDSTCANAAENGHLECLKYAHERGCPWDAKTYFCAMSNGNMEVILFLIEREHPHAQSLRLTWEKVAMPILPDADAVIGLEIALSRHRHRHDADGGHVSLREILPFWREHRRLYDEAHRAARVDALLPEIDKERRRLTDAG